MNKRAIAQTLNGGEHWTCWTATFWGYDSIKTELSVLFVDMLCNSTNDFAASFRKCHTLHSPLYRFVEHFIWFCDHKLTLTFEVCVCVCVFNKIDVANKIVCYVVVCCMTVILIYDRNDVNYGERSGKLQLKMRKQPFSSFTYILYEFDPFECTAIDVLCDILSMVWSVMNECSMT